MATKTTKKKRPYTKRTVTTVAAAQEKANTAENPFEIMNDLEYSGNRSNGHLLNALADQCMKLDANNRSASVNIPITVCPTRAAAGNLFLQLRRFCQESKNKAMRDAHFTSRGVFSIDGKKTYLGSRIWRTK